MANMILLQWASARLLINSFLHQKLAKRSDHHGILLEKLHSAALMKMHMTLVPNHSMVWWWYHQILARTVGVRGCCRIVAYTQQRGFWMRSSRSMNSMDMWADADYVARWTVFAEPLLHSNVLLKLLIFIRLESRGLIPSNPWLSTTFSLSSVAFPFRSLRGLVVCSSQHSVPRLLTRLLRCFALASIKFSLSIDILLSWAHRSFLYNSLASSLAFCLVRHACRMYCCVCWTNWRQ